MKRLDQEPCLPKERDLRSQIVTAVLLAAVVCVTGHATGEELSREERVRRAKEILEQQTREARARQQAEEGGASGISGSARRFLERYAEHCVLVTDGEQSVVWTHEVATEKERLERQAKRSRPAASVRSSRRAEPAPRVDHRLRKRTQRARELREPTAARSEPDPLNAYTGRSAPLYYAAFLHTTGADVDGRIVAQSEADAANLAAVMMGYGELSGEVLQVLDDGVLVESRSQTVFVEGRFDLTDGVGFVSHVKEDGAYEYATVTGAPKRVRKFQPVELRIEDVSGELLAALMIKNGWDSLPTFSHRRVLVKPAEYDTTSRSTGTGFRTSSKRLVSEAVYEYQWTVNERRVLSSSVVGGGD